MIAIKLMQLKMRFSNESNTLWHFYYAVTTKVRERFLRAVASTRHKGKVRPLRQYDEVTTNDEDVTFGPELDYGFWDDTMGGLVESGRFKCQGKCLEDARGWRSTFSAKMQVSKLFPQRKGPNPKAKS